MRIPLIRGRKVTYRVPVNAANPVSVAMASALGTLYGHGIDGQTGTVRYGYPALGTRSKFTGYAAPQQLFVGYNPSKVAAGAVVPTPGGLPGTQAPPGYVSPLLAAAASVTDGSMG